MNKIEKLKSIIDKSNNIVFFFFFWVSTESGIPDFRSSDGLYNSAPEEILSHSFFVQSPEIFFEFYKKNLIFRNAKPNKAHEVLAKMEKDGKLSGIITQNIDSLHQIAGSKNVFELHGSISKNYCTKCEKNYTLEEFLSINSNVPYCNCGGIIKPDVVLYEEQLNWKTIEDAVSLLEKSEVLIVGGTSLVVNPAASMINYFKGKHFIIINFDPTPYDSVAELKKKKKIGDVLSRVYPL